MIFQLIHALLRNKYESFQDFFVSVT